MSGHISVGAARYVYITTHTIQLLFCVYIYIYTYIYIYLHIYVYTYIYICIYLSLSLYIAVSNSGFGGFRGPSAMQSCKWGAANRRLAMGFRAYVLGFRAWD